MSDRDGWFAADRLHRAAAANDLKRARELIEEGAALDAFDAIGYTPLHYAVKNDWYEMVRLLIDAGADIDACDPEGRADTPVAHAAAESAPRMVDFLLQLGADPARRSRRGHDAFGRSAERRDGLGQRVKDILHLTSMARTTS